MSKGSTAPMLEGVSEILTSAVGVAISPVPIVAVTLMLFSQRARANGPAFLVGWVVALVTVSGVAYVLADNADAATDGTAADTIAWGKVSFGVLFLGLGVRTWRRRPAPGAQRELPKWMAGIDALNPARRWAWGCCWPASARRTSCSRRRRGPGSPNSDSRAAMRLAR